MTHRWAREGEACLGVTSWELVRGILVQGLCSGRELIRRVRSWVGLVSGLPMTLSGERGRSLARSDDARTLLAGIASIDVLASSASSSVSANSRMRSRALDGPIKEPRG